jgi:hypothetical protein
MTVTITNFMVGDNPLALKSGTASTARKRFCYITGTAAAITDSLVVDDYVGGSCAIDSMIVSAHGGISFISSSFGTGSCVPGTTGPFGIQMVVTMT